MKHSAGVFVLINRTVVVVDGDDVPESVEGIHSSGDVRARRRVLLAHGRRGGMQAVFAIIAFSFPVLVPDLISLIWAKYFGPCEDNIP
jgi:hypothetical protein